MNDFATAPLPRGYFLIGGKLCMRLEAGGWRVATASDRMDCAEIMEAAKKQPVLQKAKTK